MSKGVSIIELLLVIALIAIIAAGSAPIYTSFLTRQQQRNKVAELVSSLNMARVSAEAGRNDSDWGVFANNDEITLFSGPSYAGRDQSLDVTYGVPPAVSITNNEVLFERPDGEADSSAVFVVSVGSETETVTVNVDGTVSLN
jgi:prepilin-type N-terminal cleavage/methylation domain-containing protein